MQLSVKNRLIRLEQSQPKQQFCYPLSFFYGEACEPMLLIPGKTGLINPKTLADFYQPLKQDQQHG